MSYSKVNQLHCRSTHMTARWASPLLLLMSLFWQLLWHAHRPTACICGCMLSFSRRLWFVPLDQLYMKSCAALEAHCVHCCMLVCLYCRSISLIWTRGRILNISLFWQLTLIIWLVWFLQPHISHQCNDSIHIEFKQRTATVLQVSSSGEANKV